MPLTAVDLARAAVTVGADDATLLHAADEVRRHLAIVTSPGPVGISINVSSAAARTDGFKVTVSANHVSIRGDSPRGALNGSYWFLEQVGFLWVRPGNSGVRFVPGKSINEGTFRSDPSFPRRTLILGNDALHDEWRDWLEFASRNRLNSIFFHDTPPSVLERGDTHRPTDGDGTAADGKGWMFERWDSDGTEILGESRRRAMTVQFGGHHLPGLLPRGLFESHPQWFPFRNGKRDDRYNLCTSSPGAVGELRARARDFFRRFGGPDVFHLWADDIVGGGWCSCDDCVALSPSDQALRATNVVAEELASLSPDSVVAHLAYHDTIAPPTAFGPERNVSALYAPRNRNYAFAIDDENCPRNRDGHYSELLGLARTFANHPKALAVFEYYSDAVLYKWMDPPNLGILPADSRAYQRAGVFDFGNLAVTPRQWVGPTWHAWWFARCAWDSAALAPEELDTFCRASFGEHAPEMKRLYVSMDSAYRKLLDLGELERVPRHDVLDFSDTPRQALALKSKQLAEAAAEMNGAVANVPLRPLGLTSEFREDLAVQLAAVNHLADRVVGWNAALTGHRAESGHHLALARVHLRALADWDAAHGMPAYANLSRGMLRAASGHTERIAGILDS